MQAEAINRLKLEATKGIHTCKADPRSKPKEDAFSGMPSLSNVKEVRTLWFVCLCRQETDHFLFCLQEANGVSESDGKEKEKKKKRKSKADDIKDKKKEEKAEKVPSFSFWLVLILWNCCF